MAPALETDMDSSSGHSHSAAETMTTVSSASSTSSSPLVVKEHDLTLLDSSPRLDLELFEAFSESVAAKIWRIAVSHLEQDKALTTYPEFIPSTGESAGKYVSKPANFWTCGFFPGSMYAILERCMKYPGQLSPKLPKNLFQVQLLRLCRAWSEPLHGMALRVDTHDLGFIIQPALRMDWELTGNARSLQSVVTAAESLISRYDERLGAIRSWDRRLNKRESITDKETNFLIIVDSMCNLDLLYYAGHHTSNQKMIDIATSHARVVLQTVVREDNSTFHLINIDPRTGAIKFKGTHQGYSDTSTWSRGQAWAILGFTQTYIWTKDSTFLDAAIKLSNYLLARLSSCTHPHPYVPAWDLDAPVPLSGVPLRDTSAGMIAANGLLLLHQTLHNNSPYLSAAVRIAKETIDSSLCFDLAAFSVGDHAKVSVEGSESWDGILMHATANNNEDALVRYSDHGLVYADYYFLEFGNKLLRMGLV